MFIVPTSIAANRRINGARWCMRDMCCHICLHLKCHVFDLADYCRNGNSQYDKAVTVGFAIT